MNRMVNRLTVWGVTLLVVAAFTLPIIGIAVDTASAVQGPLAEPLTVAPAQESDAGAFVATLLTMSLLFGTTLAANKPRAYEGGDRNEYPVIASDIIYEGAAVGLVDASGHARPLAAGDRFVGFAEAKADNSAGAAAAINVRVVEQGKIELSVSGAVITDVGQPVYATDDDTFVFNPVSAVFVGFVHRFVSSGVVVVDFNAPAYRDPYGEYSKRETISADKTLDIEDNGKVFFVDTDAKIITLPAVATPVNCTIVNIGAFGAVAVNISPAAADKVQGPDLPGTDNKDLINTKATARRGDFARIVTGDANGALVQALRGIWATEA
jgi:hypothetical protein